LTIALGDGDATDTARHPATAGSWVPPRIRPQSDDIGERGTFYRRNEDVDAIPYVISNDYKTLYV
jgi:hypothetical protein